MDKTIITALLIIAGVVSVVFLFNAMYPAVVEGSNAMAGMERRISERFHSQIEIIHAVPDGIENTKRALVWVKNIGSRTIAPVERCDVFFGPEGNFQRIPYGAAGSPTWQYSIENDTDWKPTATIKITIDVPDYLTSGTRYYVKVIQPNGESAEYYFSK